MWVQRLIVSLLVMSQASEADSNSIRNIHAGMVKPRIVAITIGDSRRVEYGRQVPYEARKGDRVDDPQKHRWLYRGGKCIGSLVGPEGKILSTFGTVTGTKIDIAPAEKAEAWLITPRQPSDRLASHPIQPVSVFRKSKPTDCVRTGPWTFDAPVEHVLYLVLPVPLSPGTTYVISSKAIPVPAVTFTWTPERQRSEAVHVSHTGFRPDDPAKVAFLSCWMGTGGGVSYSDRLSFRVIDCATDSAVFSGRAVLSKAADDKSEDPYKRNYNRTDVYEMDFSPLKERGVYRVYVEGIGCSYPFKIGDAVWRHAFTISVRGFYHQRSGIALGPPYTEFRRPRPFHPDDGVTVYASTARLMDTGNGLTSSDSNFGNLVKGRTQAVVENAWGGYMDAGDWDRRIQHLEATRYLLDLVLLFPDYFDGLSLNIPESSDDLPDILNEALFNLDHYRRMQTPEGGIRGGVESAEHPCQGEASWQESLTVFAYAPGSWSSYLYAATAARAAFCLRGKAPALSRAYRESALRAMTWAEHEFSQETEKQHHGVTDARNLAAVELWRLTGTGTWHGLFLKTTVFSDPTAAVFTWQHHDQGEAAWVYARIKAATVDARIQKNCVNALLREADARIKQSNITGFRWTKFPWQPVGYGILSAPDAVHLVRAHVLTGEKRYLRTALLASQTGLGANPLNMCYTTGLGHRSPQHPLHIDSRITLQPPPAGLTVFGPLDTQSEAQPWAKKIVEGFCCPPVKEWPTLEAYWDVFWYPVVCEFTIHQPMARNAYVWGYLAARSGDQTE